MVGILIELAISWILLWFFSKNNLNILGFKPNKNRLENLWVGLILSGFCCTIYHLLKTSFIDNNWVLNPKVTLPLLLKSSWWTFKSVIFEELIFRGAILYLLIKRLGLKTGCLLSGIAFGIYHLVSYNALGNPVQMVIIFSMTAIFGILLAYSFGKTQSLYLPIALHFGWNWFNIVVFSSGPLGAQLFVKANSNQLQGIPSLALLLFQIIVLPLLSYWYLNYASKKTNKHKKNSKHSL
ncbi:CPBP family intramembrane glutamic endopeptidase [Chryseobacterium paridis]|uniref:CPBP family intramembrane metalloprotease n=1 Tax=Chryseobacterium paridis TaxID=2800328 RepID=A0ABS1FQE7_9FLAO|nr:type II CAAX endopeptidase family protein [Chryseobacterium paridis]MBK1894647.1 CPBP family intramembrane metalloprotease [Chryseobacterium paridis]